jgi:hypothetical protein
VRARGPHVSKGAATYLSCVADGRKRRVDACLVVQLTMCISSSAKWAIDANSFSPLRTLGPTKEDALAMIGWSCN